MIAIAISMFIISMLGFFFIGMLTVQCEVCSEHAAEIKIREIKERKIIIKTIKDEINSININPDKHYRDSLRAIINPK